jgi:periplasmic divalent cation tolerance protein
MSDDPGKCLLVMTNLPDRERAMELARSLIGKRLAACVSILNGCTSIYRWRDQLQDDVEVPLLIKTCSSRLAALQEEILAVHPYELPEIIALPIDQGHEPYLAWLRSEVDISA